MTHRRTALVLSIAACLALAGAAHAGRRRLALSGRVVLEEQRRGEPLPRFTARLYFPKGVNRPALATYTDAGGHFNFDELDAGRYLLEIYQGSDMVFQKVLLLDENLPQPLVVTLRPRSGARS
jgi:hypothetical protein